MGDDANRGRLLAGDYERDAINPPDGTSPQSAVAGRYFHLSQSVFGGVRNLGLRGEFWKDGDIERLVKELSALAPPLLELAALSYSEFEAGPQGDEPALLSYLDATYRGSAPSEGGVLSSSANGGSRSRDF